MNNLSKDQRGPVQRKSEELITELGDVLWRAQTLADELQRRFSCHPPSDGVLDIPQPPTEDE